MFVAQNEKVEERGLDWSPLGAWEDSVGTDLNPYLNMDLLVL